MKAFELGWIPPGWTRGDKLKIRNLYGVNLSTVAIIEQAPQPYNADFKYSDCGIVGVGPGEEEACNKWLAWWRDPTAEPVDNAPG